MTTDVQIAIETALYNTLAAASVGVNWYNTTATAKVAVPFGVFEFVGSVPDDTNSTQSDTFTYQVKVVDDSHDMQNSHKTAASIAGKTRDALSGPAALNTTGSMSGYTCVDCARGSRISYLDGGGFWHVGYSYDIRVTK